MERRLTNLIKTEKNFTNWCYEAGIEGWAVDVDDTLCATGPQFKNKMFQACRLMSENHGLDLGLCQTTLQEVNDECYITHYVNPLRWETVMEMVAGKLGLSGETRDEALGILMEIYDTPLQLFPDAEEFLAFLTKIQFPRIAVTHADPDWTRKKIEWLGLYQYFDPKDIYVVDMDRPKEWKGSFLKSARRASLYGGIGDSKRSDARPAYEAGVEWFFLINRNTGIWKLQQDVDVKDIPGLIYIDSLRRIKELDFWHTKNLIKRPE